MIDTDVKQLAERALLIDSVICKRLLGLSWEPPHVAALDHSGPSQPQELVGNNDCGPETEDENVFRETQKKIKELLCNETVRHKFNVNADTSEEKKKKSNFLPSFQDFLMETKVLKLLSSLENEEQTDMKLVTLLYVSPYSALVLFLESGTKLEQPVNPFSVLVFATERQRSA